MSNSPIAAATPALSKYRTSPLPIPGMPAGIPYIVGNEAAERFSFYGMKGILVIFMTGYLFMLPGATGNEPMPEPKALENYHLFTTAVYFTPILGALLADILLGKYLTIISLSIVYCLGHGVLAIMGMGEDINPAWMLFLGLGLISLGSGGIKPCVSAHVGDQFGQTNSHLISKVFGWFYFAINTGAFLSTLLTPWFLQWYGPHLAFGIPGVLMVIATIMFWMGRKVFIHVPPGGMKWVRETFSWTGLSAILKLGVIYLFVAVFWALFDQTGSSWVLQAKDLDRYWLGVHWLPSQIQAVNPIMILILIPTFSFFLYPAISRVFKLTPIRKIAIGLFVMVIGFGMVAMLQESIDAGARPSIGWQIAAYAILTASEVMVSITCLEFSYTQAPRTMKSLIMAIFLMSVSLGNVFTAAVNHVILVDSSAVDAKELATSFASDSESVEVKDRDEAAKKKGLLYESMPGEKFAVSLAGIDGVLGSEDDIKLGFAEDGTMVGFINDEADAIETAINRIGEVWEKDGRLPLPEAGQAIASSLKDPWGNPLHYQLKSRDQFIVSSEGPDQTWQSVYDIRGEVTVTSKMQSQLDLEEAQAGGGDVLAWAHPDKSWIERREDEIAAERGGEAETDQTDTESEPGAFARDIRWDVGGATTLAGAAYFWFFTWLMLGTAVVFVPVGWIYRPQTYLQLEDSA
ncbi:MAG: POT family MFS transporter [Planctomycetes bacterium]|nr:POT family MFS transporter [Planctomycetota bacterium]MCP4838542.1 POT family MFS transporter [Planctomycetota bacterium]